jgi:hypothetical protein
MKIRFTDYAGAIGYGKKDPCAISTWIPTPIRKIPQVNHNTDAYQLRTPPSLPR